MHLAGQAVVRFAMQNPASYIHSNIAEFVTLLEACKEANPQPAIVWASSSSVYGLNSKVPLFRKSVLNRDILREKSIRVFEGANGGMVEGVQFREHISSACFGACECIGEAFEGFWGGIKRTFIWEAI